ncbi:hypothetical protein LOK49_LG10G00249 [Camellia lanceoleosa]|uniref:Uncharacterized protein n=1 Tax=Camellia lanceoleosa TaxID=1840588 RepID=A0ACC0GE32_9ERIC|nr:hypothetical protein LOK49_LG10G00249 [Camellia lanceoleosa]
MDEQRDGESGGDAMAGRPHCGDSEGGVDYTPQCESQPHFRIGNNSIKSGDAIYTCQGQSQSHFVMGGNSIQDHGLGVNFSQSQHRFVMGINYNKDHRHDMYISPSQPRPQVLLGGISGPPPTYGTSDGNNTAQSMPSVYPTHRSFQELLRGASVENFAVHLSQASHSPADSHIFWFWTDFLVWTDLDWFKMIWVLDRFGQIYNDLHRFFGFRLVLDRFGVGHFYFVLSAQMWIMDRFGNMYTVLDSL